LFGTQLCRTIQETSGEHNIGVSGCEFLSAGHAVLKLSTKGRYCVRLMVDLAEHYQRGPIALSDIAQRQEISEKYLEHLIVPLKKAKLIRSVRGASGGYSLARPPVAITIHEIVAAAEGPICLVECTQNSAICKRSINCPTRGVWSELSARISETLSSLTLQELIDRKSRKKVAGARRRVFRVQRK
jgi:Rrf2 family cysteine metabolism transcriptional repressor